jgi:hypothetical protein
MDLLPGHRLQLMKVNLTGTKNDGCCWFSTFGVFGRKCTFRFKGGVACVEVAHFSA